MNLDRKIVDSVVLGGIVFFMRQDITMALVVAVVAYLLKMVNF
jgi:hypothetical protein